MTLRHIIRALSMSALALTVTACATNTSRFEWGRYESALYVYSKKPDRRETYRTALSEAIARGRAKNNVAPGMLAELGYLYMEDGDGGHAVPLFEEEMQRFPESRPFMERMIARAKGAPAVASNQGQ